jgi:hypothetical protein
MTPFAPPKADVQALAAKPHFVQLPSDNSACYAVLTPPASCIMHRLTGKTAHNNPQ